MYSPVLDQECPIAIQAGIKIVDAGLSSIDYTQFQKFFDDLPVDQYLTDAYRYRRLSNFKVLFGLLYQSPTNKLYQSKDINHLQGGMIREFEDLDPELIALPDFHKLVLAFYDFCRLGYDWEMMGVHQIRIAAYGDIPSLPTPEGIHQDGTDMICFYPVNRTNITGGEAWLYKNKNDAPVYQKIVEPGEALVFNDRLFWHYSTPINTIDPTQPGYMDFFVITYPGLLP